MKARSWADIESDGRLSSRPYALTIERRIEEDEGMIRSGPAS
jgi:hypothetical protein